MKLVLGTAEFDPAGYPPGLPALELAEIRKILACAKEGGINIIDTAERYNCSELLRDEAKGFCIYTKTKDWRVHLDWGENELRGILYHYRTEESPVKLPFIHRWVNLGYSVYDREQLPEDRFRILQVPFNIELTRFKDVFETYRTVFIRSVFGRGDLLKRYSVKDCLDFVKPYRSDGVIVGVRSAKELEEILKCK